MVAKSKTTLQDATHDLEDRPHHSTADRCAACKVHQMHLEGLGDRRTPTLDHHRAQDLRSHLRRYQRKHHRRRPTRVFSHETKTRMRTSPTRRSEARIFSGLLPRGPRFPYLAVPWRQLGGPRCQGGTECGRNRSGHGSVKRHATWRFL